MLKKFIIVTMIVPYINTEATSMHRVAVGDVTPSKRPENRFVLEDKSARADHHRQVRVAVVLCQFVYGHGR